MVLVGDAKDKIAILIDDMADTCGTIVQVHSTPLITYRYRYFIFLIYNWPRYTMMLFGSVARLTKLANKSIKI